MYDARVLRQVRRIAGHFKASVQTEERSIRVQPQGLRLKPAPTTRRTGFTAKQNANRRVRRPFSHGLIIAIAIGTAFYATFLPSNESSRASLLISVDALGYVATEGDTTQQQLETVGVTLDTSKPPARTTLGQAASQASQLNKATDATSPSGNSISQTSHESSQQASSNGTASDGQGGLRLSASTVSTPTPNPQLCDVNLSSFYCVYTVQSGDTLSTIANKFNMQGNPEEGIVASDLLMASNRPDIVNEDAILQIGQKIRIPINNGVLHTVVNAQTLGEIADQYDVTSEEILAVAINRISDPNSLSIGQEIIIPNPKQFSKPAPPPTPTPEPTSAPKPSSSASSSSGGGSGSSSGAGSATTRSGAGSTAAAGSRSGAGFIWPVSGPISSYFGSSHPLGIDIDLFSNPNAPIGAAAAGTVTFAGGNACCSYGYYVIVNHGNGYSTLYAHMSSLAVRAGEKVSQGELVGYGGSTGYSTGNHLHFEVQSGGSTISPMSVLP